MLALSLLVTAFIAWLNSSRQILVIYSFTDMDEESIGNLHFFISEAIRGDQRAEYVIVVNGRVDGLPKLPKNSRYIQTSEGCFSDWASYGLGLRQSSLDRYRTFVFVSSTARGPFMPPYAKHAGVHWTDPFVDRLTADVKLVGATISCKGSITDEVFGKGRSRRNPNVEGYALATDREGLKVLLADREVFQCHQNSWEASYYGELGASTVILAQGYNLDCFVTKYQGSPEAPMDWRDKSKWDCNGRASIHEEFMLDGVTLDPLEVMWVKFTRNALVKGVSSAVKAEKYTRWLGEARDRGWGNKRRNISSNEFEDQAYKFRIPRILEAKARGPSCFDFEFYSNHEKNQDLREGNDLSEEDLWHHFVHHGQFEARGYRFICPYEDSDALR